MSDSNTLAQPEDIDLRRNIRLLLANRHGPEARELYLLLARYIHGRVSRRCSGRYAGVLGSAEQEDLVADVLTMLMSGALGRFEGGSIPSLLAFVRTICDRTVGHAARARIRERDTLDGDGATAVAHWNHQSLRPDQAVHMVPKNPFTDQDCAYLSELFEAGTKAEYARTQGVSRAAVTQRVQRIQVRIARMQAGEQSQARAWVEDLARRTEASPGVG